MVTKRASSTFLDASHSQNYDLEDVRAYVGDEADWNAVVPTYSPYQAVAISGWRDISGKRDMSPEEIMASRKLGYCGAGVIPECSALRQLNGDIITQAGQGLSNLNGEVDNAELKCFMIDLGEESKITGAFLRYTQKGQLGVWSIADCVNTSLELFVDGEWVEYVSSATLMELLVERDDSDPNANFNFIGGIHRRGTEVQSRYARVITPNAVPAIGSSLVLIGGYR